MSLEGAWLITNRKLDEDNPHVTLHTDEGEKPYACVGLGASGNYVRIHSAEVGRGFVAAFAKAVALLEEAALAGEMDAEATRQQIREALAAADRGETADLGSFAQYADESKPEPLACGRCGATVATGGVLTTSDGVTRCHNHPLCDQRVAARDAEAAQAGAQA